MSSCVLLSLPLLWLAACVTALTESNLTCYQCVRYANEECGNDSLLACPPSKDRCVTHISKDARNGFVIKRECGLGPCGFEDAMMNRGLGLEGCDWSKDEYFCVFCCPTHGCNKDSSTVLHPSILLVLLTSALAGGTLWAL